MDPETLYCIWQADDTIQYARTPDGVGCYWYDEDQKADALADVCEVRRTRWFESNEEFEEWRMDREMRAWE